MPNGTINEQLKLRATALNNLGVACAVTGGIRPAAAFLLGSIDVDDPWRLASAIVIWTTFGLTLHIAGQRVLEDLES